MDWIKLSDDKPKMYQEVFVCTDQKRVKSAIYVGDDKFNTFTNVVAWAEFPEPPDWIECVENVDAVKKRRGRPKKT